MNEFVPRREHHRFNAIDFLVLMLLVAAVLSLVLRGNLSRELGLQEVGQKAEFTLLFSGLSKEDANVFAEEMTLIYPATGETIGKITRIEKENTRVYATDESGVVKEMFDSKQYDVTLSVQGTGKRTEKGFLINAAIFCSPGDALSVYCADHAFVSTVLKSQNV